MGYETKEQESIGNMVGAVMGGSKLDGTKKLRIWKTSQRMKEEKRKHDYRWY